MLGLLIRFVTVLTKLLFQLCLTSHWKWSNFFFFQLDICVALPGVDVTFAFTQIADLFFTKVCFRRYVIIGCFLLNEIPAKPLFIRAGMPFLFV